MIQGFKSFAERTVVKALPGITAIVGPNGAGKCLSGDTPVALADGRVLPIRKLVEIGFGRAHHFRYFDDGVAAVAGPGGLDVLSLNPVTLRLEPRPVEAFVRRSAPASLLRVRTRSGREVVTTHYHPFFSLDRGALKVLTAEELVTGVRIAVPRSLPAKGHDEALPETVAARFAPEDRIYVPHSPALEEWLEAAQRRASGWRRLAALTGFKFAELQRVTQGRPVNVAALARAAEAVGLDPFPIDRLATRRARIRVPAAVDVRFARFLGYLLAEGQTTKSNQVWFVNTDAWMVAEFSRLAKELFGVRVVQATYKPRAIDTLVFSRPLCLLLDRVFGVKVGGGSAEKTVPAEIMGAPDHVVAAFLSGLFEGDGFICVGSGMARSEVPYIEYATASRALADGVCTLLLRLGVFALVRSRTKSAANTAARRRRTYYSVYVDGGDQVRRLGTRLSFVGSKQARLDAVAGLTRAANPNLDVVPGVAPLVRAAVAAGGLVIKRVRATHPKVAAYAEGRCDASRAGLAEVADLIEASGKNPEAARVFIRQLRLLAASDVYWDEVVAIERTMPPEPWVYDLTITDTHNFVAGNVVVHNSNISEAVRWALGEQSAKSLRGTRMEDLIFHGSASRKPVGLAEVELVFANDGVLSVPWSEVSVARRLYRDGESEYLLNKSVCRLRDILDLFAGTGASPRAYSVMDQDKLNHVLTAKPSERRVFIEEAAGIARYKQQRHETQGKLEATRQNLLRVRDVMDEVKRQLNSLERQAKKARQYKVLHAEKQSLALSIVAADYATLTEEGRRLQAERDRLADAERELEVRLSALGAREVTQRAAQEDLGHRLGDLRQSVQKVQGEVERLLERREQMGVQLRELAEEELRLGEEIRATEERIAALAGDRESVSASLRDAVAAAEARAGGAEALEARLAAQRAALGEDRDRLEALRLEQVRVAAEQADLTRSSGELRERQAQLERRAARLAQELADARAEGERLAAQLALHESEQDRARATLSSLETQGAELEGLLADREPRLAAAQARLAETRVTLAARRSSLEALERLERAREGYVPGVRAMFTDAGAPRVPGIVGTVADLIEVPAGLDTAVEAVLGERLQWIVVERFQQARDAVAMLRAEGGGNATFVPIETLPPAAAVPNDEDGVRWVARAVRTTNAELLHYLLGRVAIVDHLDDAERLWRRNGVVATYVTRAGEVLSPTGRLRGGRAPGDDGSAAEHSLLQRKRALRELGDEVRRLGEELAEAQAAAAALESEVATLRQRVPALQQAIRAGEATRLAGEKDIEQSRREHERVLRHIATIQVEREQISGEQAETGATLERLHARIALVRQAEENHESAMAALRASIDAAQAEETRAVTELTACRVEMASAAERVEALKREIAHLDDLRVELAARLEQGRARQQQIRERSAWLAEERERTDVAAREIAAERDRLEGEERELAERHEALVGELRGIETESRAVQSELGRLASSAHAIELSATEGRVRREELELEARRAFSLPGPDELLALHDPARDVAATRERLQALEERLASMGAVNLVADEEYRELDERLSFLRTQHDDLVSSMKDLEKALRGVTRTAQERFHQAFEEIGRRFGEIFGRLFEGGRAELRLVENEEDGDDPLEVGVELMAQPRGKRLQAVTLMSGGEKALTGLALLFAIFYYRPSPFCVLDEVDAPLDDANIYRFLRVLRELCSQTQFLVITHNRKTMEAADVLYGVTMEEPGLSKLVSVNLAGDRL